MKRYLCLLALLCLFVKLPAQEKADVCRLSTGDSLPEVILGNILNHPTGKARLSDYRGKWVILDFWATWCSPCIAAFPKLDSLQGVFKENVQFLPVTYQSRQEVEKLMAKLDKLNIFSINLPLVVNDTALHQLFPHRELPYYIWIDPQGEVIATTGPDEVTGANIEAMVTKKKPVLENKEYVAVPFSKDELLLAGNRDMGKKPVQFQSALLPYMEGLSSGYTIFPANQEHGKRILATNSGLISLLQLAYSNGKIFFGRNRTILEVKDTAVFISGETGKAFKDWQQSGHSWCYELVVPHTYSGDTWKLMQEDLSRYFSQYSIQVEERKRPCLVLVRTGSKDKIKSKGGKYSMDSGPFGMHINNGQLSNLVLWLNALPLQDLSTPVIDETGYSGKVNLQLEAKMSDVASLKEALRPFGLDLVEKDKKIKVLVIKDNPQGT